MTSFLTRVHKTIEDHSALCLGIDPSEGELREWGLPNSAQGVLDFGLRCLDAAVDNLGFIKPQVAFFERFGSQGILALEQILAEARAANLFVISDAKRGDIGTTMQGYSEAWFGDDSPLRSDALTVSGYLGPDSLEGMLEYASDVNGGLFVLCATSNPEAKQLQTARQGNKSVSKLVLDAARKAEAQNLGLVIGATQELSEFGLGEVVEQDCKVAILAPGFGAQGARLGDIQRIFGASAKNVIASMSRGLTSMGPDKLKEQIKIAKEEIWRS